MITNIGDGDYEIICDNNCGCRKEIWADNNWNFLMRELKKQGWTAKKINNLWHNYCPSCSSNMKDKEINHG